MGRHSRQQAQVPAPRRPGIGLVDATTGTEHQVSFDAMAAGRSAGVYQAMCRAEVLVASMTAPATAWCTECARRTL